jgi:hypothetical protein
MRIMMWNVLKYYLGDMRKIMWTVLKYNFRWHEIYDVDCIEIKFHGTWEFWCGMYQNTISVDMRIIMWTVLK